MAIKTKLLMLTPVLMLSVLTVLPARAEVQPYIVTNDNHLDAETYKGFQLYRNWCARCHGTYGQGLAGPNLANSLNTMSYQAFLDIVAKGKKGKTGMMPAWQSNKQVMDGREHIYRYLKARADGAIGAVQPIKAQ